MDGPRPDIPSTKAGALKTDPLSKHLSGSGWGPDSLRAADPDKRMRQGHFVGEIPTGLKPKEIIGLNGALQEESWGGNAGTNRAGLNANFIGNRTEFLFTNHPYDDVGRDSDVTFGIIGVTLKQMRELSAQGKPIPPALIERVLVNDKQVALGDFLRKRAFEHNASEALIYLNEGGDPKLLPETTYLQPTSDLLDQNGKTRKEWFASKLRAVLGKHK